MKIAVVGATGLVGRVMLKVIAEMNLPITELIPVASKRSAGKKITFGQEEITVVSIEAALKKQHDLALFSAGSATSLEWAPKFAEKGIKVIDNSSAWRMDSDKPLIIPEVNGSSIKKEDMIIANPNCSTIQMLMALGPIHREFTIERAIVSTYQSISGTGTKAIQQMEAERAGKEPDSMAYPYKIDQNCLPHCDDFLDNDYTKEEMKMVNETHKILDNEIKLTATAVRVPVQGGHSESINLTLKKDFDVPSIQKMLHHSSGITVQDNPVTNTYPMPLMAEGKNDVFVGRLRRDHSQDNGLNLWIVSDNLRKGAATNTVQIAQYMLKNGLL